MSRGARKHVEASIYGKLKREMNLSSQSQSFEYEPPTSPHIEHKMENWRCSDCSECTEIEEARFS